MAFSRFIKLNKQYDLEILGLDILLPKTKPILNDRKQFVDVGGTRSEFCDIKCGVPQGSILGPVLFLLYVNDMSNAVGCDLYFCMPMTQCCWHLVKQYLKLKPTCRII